MKVTKRIFTVLLALILLCTTIPFVAAQDVITREDNGIKITLDCEGTLTISGEGEITDLWDLRDVDFEGLSDEEMEELGYKRALEEGYLPIRSVIINEGITIIGDRAFEGCYSLESIVIPESVTIIGYEAFRYCSIKSIHIPASVEYIGLQAFEDAYLLNEITVDDNNQYFSSLDGCLYNKDQSTIIKYPEAKKGDTYIIPEQTKRIGERAFWGNDYIKQMIVPATVEYIASGSFCACINLQNLCILNPECVLPFDAEIVSNYSTIYGYENSTAECNALATNRRFIPISDEQPTNEPTQPEPTSEQVTEPSSEEPPVTQPTTEPTTEPTTQPEPQKEEAPQNFFQKIAAFFRNLFDRLFSIFRR